MKTKTCHRIKHGLSKLEDSTEGLSDEKKMNDKSKNTYERTFNTQAFDSVVCNMSKNARL